MPADGAAASPFELFVVDAPQRFHVESFLGRERISETYALHVRLLGPAIDAGTLERQFVGRRAHFQFTPAGGSERWIHGMVAQMEWEGRHGLAEDRHGYLLALVPALQALAYRQGSRIFQDKTAVDIVKILLEAGRVRVELRLSRTYRARSYCVQHQESDLHFVERLLAEEGIFYFFEHPPGQQEVETLVLADDAKACKPIAGSAVVHVAKSPAAAWGPGTLRAFALRRRLEPSSVVLKDFDFSRPSFNLQGRASAAPAPAPAPAGPGADAALEQYHHHGEVEPPDLSDATARTRLEQHRREVWVGAGESHDARFEVGHTVEVRGAELESHPGSYTLFEVEHEGHGPMLEEHERSGETYRNRFRCVPAETPFRPKPPPPRIQQVLETATVVGPSGEEIHTDPHGRIKVKFHWDREGAHDDHASCWIRVMQPWAGAGWGVQFIPRVGMEVVVAFLAGDADRPMVIGTVHNPEHPPTFALPHQRTKSGIRTRSTAGGDGYNEISFDDRAGAETLLIRAQKDLGEAIGANHATKVAKDQSLVVMGDQMSSVGGDMSVSVAGHRRDAATLNRAESTGGNVLVSVGGSRREVVKGHHSLEVNGATSASLHGAANLVVEQHASVTALKSLTVAVGAADSAGGILQAKGSWFVGADQDVDITAARSVTLRCGESVLRITPDRVEISAKEVVVKGGESAVVRGKSAVLELAGEAKLAGPATRLFGVGSSMELTADAAMKGARVKLNYREGDPPIVADETARAPTRTLSLALSDGSFTGYANRPYELTVDGVRVAGTTGGDGSVSCQIPESATQAHLIVWVGDPPTGKSRTWNLVIGQAPAASSLDGARDRLKNLGYRSGTGDELDPETARGLRDFQHDHGLEVTGEVDGATASKLEEIHGH